MFKHAAAALLIVALAQAAAIPISADEATDRTVEPRSADGSFRETGLGPPLSMPGPDSSVPELSMGLLIALVLLAVRVASIPGRH